MSIDIKTVNIKPLRITFDHLAERLGEGKIPTRYQEAIFDIQPTEISIIDLPGTPNTNSMMWVVRLFR